MRKQDIITSIENFIEKYWKDSNQENFAGIPNFIVEALTDDEKLYCTIPDKDVFKLYLILFKYNETGYTDIMYREEDYNRENENDRRWFRVATRFAVERQNLRKKGFNTIIEPQLFEIDCKCNPKRELESIEIHYPPIDALEKILERDIPVPNLVKLEIGESIQEIPVSNISSMSTLDTIYSYAKVPPTLPSMTNKHYINTIVKVPADALEAYKNANSWKNFWNLSAMESSGISDIRNETSPKIIGRYDLNGNRVDENYKGISIVRFSDGSSRKYINN